MFCCLHSGVVAVEQLGQIYQVTYSFALDNLMRARSLSTPCLNRQQTSQKAGMSMAEGFRAILASGVLEDESESGCLSIRAGAVDGAQSTRGRPRALEYFNSQEGAWQLVRNESDW